MLTFTRPPVLRLAALLGAITLAACSPKFDWREVRGADAPYVILMPGKPSSASRPINLDGTQVTMTMTAAEVDGVSFALGTAEMPDAAAAQAGVQSMKTAMVRNINGTIVQEKPSPAGTGIEIEARGAPDGSGGGQPRLLFARFIAKDKRIYQAVVVGREKSVSREAVDTFLTSFKTN